MSANESFVLGFLSGAAVSLFYVWMRLRKIVKCIEQET